jgi:hypothetical protein
MNIEPNAMRDLARTIVAREAGPSPAPAEVADAAERIVARLVAYLGRWIGLDGCGVLLGTALHRASVDWPFLAPVRCRTRAAPHLDGLDTHFEGRDGADAAEATVGLLAEFMDLLAGTIGADLARRLVVKAVESESAKPDESSGRRHDW